MQGGTIRRQGCAASQVQGRAVMLIQEKISGAVYLYLPGQKGLIQPTLIHPRQ
jgi:hypothetical protein